MCMFNILNTSLFLKLLLQLFTPIKILIHPIWKLSQVVKRQEERVSQSNCRINC